jgi:predicted O-linked N-acetylglucosamine transferase (SPINDLY family)
LFIKAISENYEPLSNYLNELKTAGTNKQAEKQKNEIEQKRKIEAEKNYVWQRAEKRLNDLPETACQKLHELKRLNILAKPQYKDADTAKLKIINSVLGGLIRSAIIEDFIGEEQGKSL